MDRENYYKGRIANSELYRAIGEELGLVAPVFPPSSKYKREHEGDPETAPDIYVGQPVILRYETREGILGYAKAVVLDFYGNERVSIWTARTTFIVQITEVSNPAMECQVGRLKSAEYRVRSGGVWRKHGFSIASFEPKEFEKNFRDRNVSDSDSVTLT